MRLVVLLFVTRLTQRYKPPDWLSADIYGEHSAVRNPGLTSHLRHQNSDPCPRLVVDLGGTCATIRATIGVSLQNYRTLTFPIV
jgi:hypothetical protein